jgi:HK97 family phage portal protein
LTGGYTAAGVNVTLDTAVGLPAFGAGVRLLGEIIAQLPLNVYRGRGADKRLADGTWQYRLLAEMPGMGDFTPFDLVSDIVGCLECNGNAFLQKVKAADQVIALIVIDPANVQVDRDNGEKVFLVRDGNGRQVRYTSASVLHIRGFTTTGSDVGLSPIAMHRQKLGAIQAQNEFHGRFFGQGTTTDIAVKHPGRMNDEQQERFFQNWRAHKTGLANAHLPLVLQDNADVVKLGMSLDDSQFVEGERLNLTQVAHILRLPVKFLTGEGDLTEWDFLSLYTLAIAPRLRRIELALFADPDLFPQRIIYPEFDTKPLLRTDAKTQAEVAHIQIQDGSMLPDEYRAEQGKPPLPPMPADPSATPGMVPQITPVGGAPNPAASGEPAPVEE